MFCFEIILGRYRGGETVEMLIINAIFLSLFVFLVLTTVVKAIDKKISKENIQWFFIGLGASFIMVGLPYLAIANHF